VTGKAGFVSVLSGHLHYQDIYIIGVKVGKLLDIVNLEGFVDIYISRAEAVQVFKSRVQEVL